MAKEEVEVKKKASVGNEDVGASAGAEAHAGAEVTDSSVSAEAGVSAGAEAHAGTTVGGVDMEAEAHVEAEAHAEASAEVTDTDVVASAEVGASVEAGVEAGGRRPRTRTCRIRGCSPHDEECSRVGSPASPVRRE